VYLDYKSQTQVCDVGVFKQFTGLCMFFPIAIVYIGPVDHFYCG